MAKKLALVSLLLLAGCGESSVPVDGSPGDPSAGTGGELPGAGAPGTGGGVGSGGDGAGAGAGLGSGGSTAGTGEPGLGPEGDVWLTSGGAAKIMHLDAVSEAIVNVFDVGEQPTAIAHGAGFVWYARNGTTQLERIHPDGSLEVTGLMAARDVFFNEDRVWCTTDALTVASADAPTVTDLQTIALDQNVDDPIVAFGGGMWVMIGNAIVRVDAATRAITGTVDLSELCDPWNSSLASIDRSDDAVWALVFDASGAPGQLLKIDATTQTLAANLELPSVGHDDGVVHGYGSIWVTSELLSKVYRIDPLTATITAEYALPEGHPNDVEAGSGSIWMVDLTGYQLWRLVPEDGSVHSIKLDYPPSDLTIGAP